MGDGLSKRIEQLHNEMKSLREQAKADKKCGDDKTALTAQLEWSIASYKEIFALLDSQAGENKIELENVQANMDRRIG